MLKQSAHSAAMAISNEKLRDYPFLQEMYGDDYFPNVLVNKGRQILIRLCERIEEVKPKDNAALFRLTYAATEDFNALNEKFQENDSEIETVARDAIAKDFEFIMKAYGFEADLEEAIAPRDW